MRMAIIFPCAGGGGIPRNAYYSTTLPGTTGRGSAIQLCATLRELIIGGLLAKDDEWWRAVTLPGSRFCCFTRLVSGIVAEK